ncbi:VC_2705 family sodium/solute symporter [Telmatospirillum sp.]|uniref:VC_2705 family sodium/solute symporter n=1 Tax=Telmatospirillum sp. TaxID=2079197 RepID=UPI00283BABBD|nr:VC_2705 family sodium/solute symporter [Telmatospirillum sp.]MDR3435824.1 VC_2705 family sodium/solute symporter [Telmatospirillum sp.]
MLRGDFTQNMGRVFAIYIGGCLLCATILILLSLAGVPDRIIGIAFILLTVVFYASMGLLGRTAPVSDHYQVPALYNGMATAADWMSAASFIGLAGAIYAAGYDGLAFVLGWTGGYILVAVLLAPYLRKFGQFTVPDFLGVRYGGRLARMIGAAILVSVSFTYVVAQLYGTGIIAARFLGIDFSAGVFVGLAGILLCSLLGGLRALIWTQVAQYVVVITAYLIPVVVLSIKTTGLPLPQLMYGRALQGIAALSTDASLLPPSGLTDGVNFFGVAFCLMLGTASLPHVLSRFFATPSVREARLSVAWSLLFLFVLYSTAPAYAAFAKLEIISQAAGHNLTTTTGWIAEWSRIGLLTTGGGGSLSMADIHIDPDAIVLATPEIAGLPFVVAALVAAGVLAAAMSSADGLLLSIGKAVAHDIGSSLCTAKDRPERHGIVARTSMIIAGMLAAWFASTRPAGIVTVVGWAFSLAASGLFPALVLGIWWKRTTGPGAVAGMLAGWIICLGYILLVETGLCGSLFGVRDIAAGVFGVPVAFATTLIVSLCTRAPAPEMIDFIDSIRVPRGAVRPPKAGRTQIG